MKNFKIEMMNRTNYNKMMGGHNDYCVEEIWIKAETKEQAYKMACEKYPEYHINTFIVTQEEIEEAKKAWNNNRVEEEKKAKEKADRKAKREEEKAEEMGITIEDYKEYKKAIANKRRYETEIEKQKEIIEKAKKAIKAQERKIKEMQEKIEKF